MNTHGDSHPPMQAWVAAIHLSETDLSPLGAAVVIDDYRLLTCRHVIASGNGQARLWIAFPKAPDVLYRRRVARISLPNSPLAAEVADLAVLELEDAIPEGVTKAPLRRPKSSDLINRKWWAFGFSNNDYLGNSAYGTVGADLSYGWIRLDCESRYRIAPGFSGSGLWSPDYEAVVGLVGQANDQGDGRSITLYHAIEYLPNQKLDALTRWSIQDGDERALAVLGWTLDSRRRRRLPISGADTRKDRNFRFCGRSTALNAIINWLDQARVDVRALVITGSPGVGKSAVLGRVVATADRTLQREIPHNAGSVYASPGSVACAVTATGKTALDIAVEIARAASARLPEFAQDIAPALRDRLLVHSGERFNVIIDAIDEAITSAEARLIITGIILPILEICGELGAQVVASTRRFDDGGDIFRVFGDALSVIDLDSRPFFTREDLVAHTMTNLQILKGNHADGPYETETVARLVAERIADLSRQNFLIAGLVARAHGLYDREAINPTQLRSGATVSAALQAYVEKLNPLDGVSAEVVLTALAFAEAPGFTIRLWQIALEAIAGRRISIDKLIQFTQSSAANFLVDSGDDSASRTFSLFHQALNDALLDSRLAHTQRIVDERALTEAFIAEGKRNSWHRAPSYLLRSLAVHAIRAGMIDDLFSDDIYLLHADLKRLTTVTDYAGSFAGLRRARLLQLTPQAITANAATRAALFSVTVALENPEDTFMAYIAAAPYSAAWASARTQAERSVIDGHIAAVNGVCAFSLNKRVLLASVADDRTLRIWDPATGQEQRSMEGHGGWVNGVCSFTLRDRVLLASAADDETVRIWDPATGQQLYSLTGHTSWVRSVCAFSLDDRVLLASGGDDCTIRIWDPATGRQLLSLEGHKGGARSVCAFSLDDRVLLASGGDDCTIRIWDPATGRQLLSLEGHTGRVNGICAFPLDDRVLLASAADDRTIRIWDPATGRQLLFLKGHVGGVRSVCVFGPTDRSMLASTADDETIRIWDPSTGREECSLAGHTGWINGVCAFTFNDRVLLASAADDRTVRIWNPAIDSVQTRVVGHVGRVRSVCAFSLGDRVLLASAADDCTVRIWDPSTGQQLRSLEGHFGWVRSVCAFSLGDRVLLASAADDRTIRIWDPSTGQQLRSLKDHNASAHAVCAFTINERVLLASGADDRSVRIWDPATGRKRRRFAGRTGGVRGLCAFTLSDEILLASASDDETIRIWDPVTGLEKQILEGHTGWVNAVCSFTIGDRVLLASAADDCTVRIWDPVTGRQQCSLEGHIGRVNGVCSFRVSDRVLLASAADDRTVRIWNPTTGVCSFVIPTHHPALASEYVSGLLVIALTAGLLAIKLKTDH